MPPETRHRAGIRLEGAVFWGNDQFENAVYLDVVWDTELGWHLHETHELGAGRGYGHLRHELGLDPAVEPAVVAQCVERLLSSSHE